MHSSMAGMSIVDEELNAMLQSDDHSRGPTTLASVLSRSTPPGMEFVSEHIHSNFSTQYSSLQGGFSSIGPGRQPASAGVVNVSAMESSNVLLQAARVPTRSVPVQQPLWPFNDEQKSQLESKIRVMKIASNGRGNSSRFRPTLGANPQGLNPPFSGALHRYHSAPSNLLENLAEEVAFSQVSSSPGDSTERDGHNDSLMSSFFSGNNLTPITEGVPQPMETDKLLHASTLHQYNQFLSPPTEPEKQPSLITTSMFGAKQDSVPAKRLGKKPRPPKVSLIRQSSLPADWLGDVKDGIDETGPSPQIPCMTSSDESLSGGTSEETGAAASGKALMYSRDDSFFLNHTSSGGLWNSLPGSVGLIAGNRLCGVLGGTVNDTGVRGEGSLRELGQPGTLIRHSSLPATINRPTSPGIDDIADFSVPCRARAKRGCATHPRSIAERIRRTKITERMKRLQDLVPNMDKQTNTSDMLDEAVEYVKELKQKVQDLSDMVVQLREMQMKGIKAEGQGTSEL